MTSTLDETVCDELHALPAGKEPTALTEYEAGLESVEYRRKSCPSQESNNPTDSAIPAPKY
jgi:hypothetical protein